MVEQAPSVFTPERPARRASSPVEGRTRPSHRGDNDDEAGERIALPRLAASPVGAGRGEVPRGQSTGGFAFFQAQMPRIASRFLNDGHLACGITLVWPLKPMIR